jgi:hypothetical protein
MIARSLSDVYVSAFSSNVHYGGYRLGALSDLPNDYLE